MSILKIYHYPEKVLRQKAAPITEFTNEIAILADDMAETMWDAPGVGLAAPQVGKSLRMIVVDIRQDHEEKPQHMVLVNPEIIAHENMQTDEEGCLSLPELVARVDRYYKITVRYQDLTGTTHQLETTDRFAVVLQHEIDHLNGILFLDHLSPLKRNLYKKKVKKWMKG